MKQPTLAAIDLGTNSCRLLIADRSGRTLYKNAISTRLGEGMSAGNRLPTRRSCAASNVSAPLK